MRSRLLVLAGIVVVVAVLAPGQAAAQSGELDPQNQDYSWELWGPVDSSTGGGASTSTCYACKPKAGFDYQCSSELNAVWNWGYTKCMTKNMHGS